MNEPVSPLIDNDGAATPPSARPAGNTRRQRTSRDVLTVVLLALAAASLPFWPIADSYVVSVGVRALIFIMLGQAWNVIAGLGGQMSLGHGVFFGTGAYTAALLFNDFGITPWLGLWVGMAIAVLLAVTIGVATMRSRGIYFALATIVISLGFEKIGRYLVDITGGDSGLAVKYLGNAPSQMQFHDPAAFLWLDVVVVLAFYLFTRWLLKSRFGLRLQAVRDDEEAAAASGVNVLGVKLAGLSISAAMASLAGTLYVQFYLSIDPGTAFGLQQSIQIQLPALIGGIGTAVGPLLGGGLAVLLSEATNWFATRYGVNGLDTLVYGAVILLVVLYAPRGLVGLFKGRGARRLP